MRTVVCYKAVFNNEQISINPDKSISTAGASLEIGQYDLNAVEAGARLLSEGKTDSVIALSAVCGAADDSKMRKSVLSRGVNELVLVKDDAMGDADTYMTACALSAAVKSLGDVELVIFGEGSGDVYSQQTGAMTGAGWGWPTVNAVSSVGKDDQGRLIVTRQLETCTEELEVELPAVICVTSDINTPRIPSLKEIMAAGKKPVKTVDFAELGLAPQCRSVAVDSVEAPEQHSRRREVYDADNAEAIEELCRALSRAAM